MYICRDARLLTPPKRARSLHAQALRNAWSENWKTENERWIAYHLIGSQPDTFADVKALVSEGLAPLGFTVLILELDYGFQFKSHPELEAMGLVEAQAREFAELRRKHGIRLIPRTRTKECGMS